MFSAFSTALSALTASSAAVNTVGNNLANLNTTGYKSDDVQFYDLMSQQLGAAGSAVGLGGTVAQSFRQFTQGSIQQTTGALDAAISGDGFFVVRDSGGQTLYSRAGNFQLAADGSLLTATGQKVQGWNASGGSVNLNGAVSDIMIPLNGVSPATATGNVSVTANLDSRGTIGGTTGSFSAPVSVVDAQGGTHILTFTFTKKAVNQWDYTVSIPAADLQAGGTTQLGTGSLTFDGTGRLTSPASGSGPIALPIAGLASGAADMSVNWNLFDASGNSTVTQFAQNSGLSATQQDGLPAGQVAKVSMGDNGMLVASYSNGQQTTVAQLALAAIRNPATLVSVGNNNLKATVDTAEPAIGTADSGGRGKVIGSALESSTVDIAQQFTNLISFQRSYQANSKVITTDDQMLQDLINLKQ